MGSLFWIQRLHFSSLWTDCRKHSPEKERNDGVEGVYSSHENAEKNPVEFPVAWLADGEEVAHSRRGAPERPQAVSGDTVRGRAERPPNPHFLQCNESRCLFPRCLTLLRSSLILASAPKRCIYFCGVAFTFANHLLRFFLFTPAWMPLGSSSVWRRRVRRGEGTLKNAKTALRPMKGGRKRMKLGARAARPRGRKEGGGKALWEICQLFA